MPSTSQGRQPRPTPDQLVEAARDAHHRRPGPMSLAAFEKLTGISPNHITRSFDGGWKELRQKVGIPLHRRETIPHDDEHLLSEFHRIAGEVGGIPRWDDINRLGRISQTPYHTRFGRKSELLRRYGEWLKEREPESALIGELDDACRRAEAVWPKRRSASGPVYGEGLQIPSLGHAPTNEKGVIYLFGVLAEKLGFRVESIDTSFPDCEAKRAIDAARSRWQRLRIEFEHRSRNFREHKHDPAGCDLIVCWQDDWPECPVEVLELQAVVREEGQ